MAESGIKQRQVIAESWSWLPAGGLQGAVAAVRAGGDVERLCAIRLWHLADLCMLSLTTTKNTTTNPIYVLY
jgi:hypothetical protein